MRIVIGGWERKETAKEAVAGPLKGVALQRLRAAETAELRNWVDNSLAKIGRLVSDSRRATDIALLRAAEEEAGALVQAIQELADRRVV